MAGSQWTGLARAMKDNGLPEPKFESTRACTAGSKMDDEGIEPSTR